MAHSNKDGHHRTIAMTLHDGKHGVNTFFEMKGTTKMAKVMDMYADRHGCDPLQTLRFYFDGIEVKPIDTANSVSTSELRQS